MRFTQQLANCLVWQSFSAKRRRLSNDLRGRQLCRYYIGLNLGHEDTLHRHRFNSADDAEANDNILKTCARKDLHFSPIIEPMGLFMSSVLHGRSAHPKNTLGRWAYDQGGRVYVYAYF